MTNMDPGFERFAEAVSGIFDPAARFAEAVSAAWNSPAAQAGSRAEVRMHAERRPDGTLLRISDVQGGRSVEVVLPVADARALGRYLNR